MFLLVIFQAKWHRDALALIATQQRAMQAELARLADVLESLVADRPLDASEDASGDGIGSPEGREEWRSGQTQRPEEDASYVPGLDMMLSRGGEEFPNDAESGGICREAERTEGTLSRLSLRTDAPAKKTVDIGKGSGMPELKL